MNYDDLTRDERNLLLYLETRMVDGQGFVDSRRMNSDDFDIAKRWAAEGLIEFGRTKARALDVMNRKAGARDYRSNWVRFSDEAWRLAAIARRKRSDQWLESAEKRYADIEWRREASA